MIGITTGNGLFFGGGLKLLSAQLAGIIAVGMFVSLSSGFAWIILKSTIGIRVSVKEEIEGLDIGEHGDSAYPEFVIRKPTHYNIEEKINKGEVV
ncbi:MAG: hypothetical protein QW265_05505 [Candidatus Bathyarchaeia archaeon]